jgi:DHA1 family multidrug resistance protein-like MFS transporter
MAAETSNQFLFIRFMQGIGAGSCYVVAFAILRDTLDDRRRAKVLSMINGIRCIIPVIAPVIGHVIMLKFPWQSLFNTMADMGQIGVGRGQYSNVINILWGKSETWPTIPTSLGLKAP